MIQFVYLAKTLGLNQPGAAYILCVCRVLAVLRSVSVAAQGFVDRTASDD